MLLSTAGSATDTTVSIMGNLVAQLANLKFEGALMYVLLMLAAGFICLEGYGIYRAALAVIGFAVGYSHIHNFVKGFEMTEQTMFMVQVIAGLICAALAYTVLKIGIFIAVYHFVQANLSAILVAMLAERIGIPEIVYPVFSAVAGAAIAFFIAKLSTKAERIVVVCVTAVVGGFAAVGFFVKLIPVFPVDITFLEKVPQIVWTGAKVFMSAAGFMVQGATKEK
ncbi:MAG: hypothetical protein K6B44_06065 [Lachnospiraceae bacterium]|nr:hypothetical protein [Lachnospiraceae bacterium]